MNQPLSPPKILVAPLDWGLGHATRCIPIIRQLIADNCTVLIAASGKVKTLLEAEFPDLRFLHLPGYNIEYAVSGWGLAAKIVVQIPKILSAIKEEQAWLHNVVEEENIDAVIADNRYGLHHPGIRTVFLSHQLLIKAPVKIAEDVLQDINYNYINQFNECWVPDLEGDDNFAGSLSHPVKLPAVPVYYVGILSRFADNKNNSVGSNLLVVLSGPEPQRSLLENLLIGELENYAGQVDLVRGLPEEKEPLQVKPNISVFNHLPAVALEEKMSKAAMVIARSGYSTVMDLAVLRKKSILIPTPGQTEQEYLSEHLLKKNFALCIPQKKFRLRQALALSETFNYNLKIEQPAALKPAIKRLLNQIAESKSAG
jgi:uncharacterized protein (TIGR00661 family)